MARVQVPKVSVSDEEAEVTEILVKVGQVVTEGQPVATLAADKVDFEVWSPIDGTVTEILAGAGSVCSPGEVIMVIAE